MIIKEAKYKKVRVTQTKEVTPEVYGCDCCKAEIKEYPNEANRLEVTVFKNNSSDSPNHYHLCSWKCVLKFIPTIESNYFATLPYLYFDEGKGKRTAGELIKLLTNKK